MDTQSPVKDQQAPAAGRATLVLGPHLGPHLRPHIKPDWERIELDYRCGIKTLRQMGAENGLSHTAINKRAKRDGWVRDLSAKINAKVQQLVSQAVVKGELSRDVTGNVTGNPTGAVVNDVVDAVTDDPAHTVTRNIPHALPRAGNANPRIAERETVEANAAAIAQVRLAHRRDIQRSRKIVMSLLDELEQQAGVAQAALLEELGTLLRSEDEKKQDKLNDLYHKVISLPNRVKTMKECGEALRLVVGMERQAFNMDQDRAGPVDALTALLHGISQSNNNAFVPVTIDPAYDPPHRKDEG